MSKSSTAFLNSFFLVIGYAAVFFIVQLLLFKTGVVSNYPGAEGLLSGDAGWYYSIAKGGGYKFWEAANNTGFYILFPAVWHLSQLGVVGISCLNIVFFALGFSVLNAIYKFSTSHKILFLTIPSMFYMFVPYAEALFFLLSSVCLYGIVHKKRGVIWISLFLIALTRANAAIFLPVFVLAELLCNDRKDWLKSTANALYTYGLPLLMGTIVFVVYQYYATGIWFVYFKSQTAYWDRRFAIPTFPLGSYLGAKVLLVNALALFIGLISLLVLIKAGLQWLLKNIQSTDKLLLIAKLYLAAVLFLILFFNPTWDINATNVFGAHRYALASPFVIIFLVHFIGSRTYKMSDFLVVFFIGNVFWLLFGSYLHIQTLLYFNFNSALIVCYMLSADKKMIWPGILVIAINIVMQVSMFQLFINKVFMD